jgi:hypothetical protein
MPRTAVVIVCLPRSTPTDLLVTEATTLLTAATTATAASPAGHFAVSTRLRRRHLIQPWQRTAAGGPIRLLDLDHMRASGYRGFLHRWHIWNQVVAGTRPAQPPWHFWDRARTDAKRYSMHRARQDYLAQPRITVMRTYNALPHRLLHLPTSHLEAFQTGPDGYANLGLLCAVPADGLVTADGAYRCAPSDRLADQLSYLDEAQQLLAGLDPRERLVALACD